MKEGKNTRVKKQLHLEFSPPEADTFEVPIWKAPPRRFCRAATLERPYGCARTDRLLTAQSTFRRVEIRFHQFSLCRLAGSCPPSLRAETGRQSFLYAAPELADW